MYKFLCELYVFISLVKHLRVEMIDHKVTLLFTFVGTNKLLSFLFLFNEGIVGVQYYFSFNYTIQQLHTLLNPHPN